jgi:hypothetical protein
MRASFGIAINGRCPLGTKITWTTAPTTDWAPASGPVIAVAIMDSVTVGAGNWMYACSLECPLVIKNGDPAPVIEIGGIKIGDV